MSLAHNAAELFEYPFLIYRIETTPGSSGSPVLNWNGRAVAIHKGAWDNEKDLPDKYRGKINFKRKGVIWWAILPEFLEARAETRYVVCTDITVHYTRIVASN